MCYTDTDPTTFEVQFFPGGTDGPVREHLRSLKRMPDRKAAAAKLGLDLRLLQEEGLTSKHISVQRIAGVVGSVWELRRSFEGIKYRIYFCVRDREIWLLHSLEKKSPRIPHRDLELIRRRAKEVLSR